MSESTAQAMETQEWEVPDYRTTRFFDRTSRYCICIFVINEGENIRKQLGNMTSFAGQVDIIIADGGSTDGSLEPGFLETSRVCALLTKTGPGKLSAQMRMAFAYAIQAGYEGVITIDGNNKDGVEAITRFVEALDNGYDHIQGSRFIPGGEAVNTPLSRLVGVRFVHAPLISLSSGFHYTDTTNGFRAYSRRFLLDPRVLPFRDIFVAYELHYYLAIRAVRLQFRVTEVPVTRRYPAHGKTPTKISPLKGNAAVLFTLFKACLRRFDPVDAK
jgi:glycosyltransferase involved in cell wall biosynthesis